MEQNFENTQQENKSPEREIVEKVEAIPAGEVLNPTYYEKADYWNRESVEEADEYISLENVVGDFEIKHTPFDAEKALKGIRHFSPDEWKLPSSEKRKIHQERLAAIKHNLEFQKQGTAHLIRELRNMVLANPEASHEELFSRVKEFAPAYGFTRNQLGLFNYAIAVYRDRHEAVGKYRALYPDDSDLFEACFGRKPEGEVRVLQGPMTLHFRCFHSRDFAAVYYCGGKNRSREITREDVDRTNSVGGVAKRAVKIEELLLTVTAENASQRIVGFEIVPQEHEVEVRDQEFELYVGDTTDTITIAADEKNIWRLQVVERDSLKMASRFQLIRPDAPEWPPVFDVRVVDAPEEIRKKLFIHKLFEDVQHPEAKKNLGNIGELLRTGEKHYGHLLLDPCGFLTLTPLGKGVKIRYQQEAVIPVVDKKASEATRVHEEQHQFNTLFAPSEVRQEYLELMQGVAKAAQDPPDAVEKLIHGLVRFERRYVGGLDMDNSARDEILAFYKDGRNPQDIYGILTQSPLYDYVEEQRDKMSRIPQEITEEVRRKMNILYYKERSEGGFTVDPEEVKPYLDLVFREEYHKDLQRWIDSISVLERKGYNREEIISFLYQEPAWRWPAFSRRIQSKNANKQG